MALNVFDMAAVDGPALLYRTMVVEECVYNLHEMIEWLAK